MALLIEEDLTAWEELYDSYAPLIYGKILQTATKEEAPSFLAATFAMIHEKISDYLPNEERLFTWMSKLIVLPKQVANSAQPSSLQIMPKNWEMA